MRILVLRALGLGDLLTAVPALRGIRRRYPRDPMVLAGPRSLHRLVGCAGVADVTFPATSLHASPPTIPGIGLAVNLHGRGPQSHRWLAGATDAPMIAFRHPEAHDVADAPTWVPDEHEVHRWCRLVQAAGIDADPQDLSVDPPPAPAHLRGLAIVHPGAKDAARRWPADRWAGVARALSDRGIETAITGTATERALCRQVAEASGTPSRLVLAGELDVLELASLVAGARIVLSGDTGIAHLAVATGRPSITLFGPTPPALWGPPPDRHDRHLAIWTGSTGDPHAGTTDRGLLAIAAGDVVDRLDAMLDRLDHPVVSGRRSAGRG